MPPEAQYTAVAIRRCIADDAPVLSAIASRTFRDTFAGTCTEADMQDFLDTFYNKGRLQNELANPADLTFFAEINGRPAGYIRFLENKVPFPHNSKLRPLELNRLYVDSAYKGRGIAQQLMDFYMAYAAGNGYYFLWLGVWEHNYRAQAFYRKYGFTFTGYRHPFPIGNTPQTDEWWAREQ